jgi:predicted GNAT family acetyltransferase
MKNKRMIAILLSFKRVSIPLRGKGYEKPVLYSRLERYCIMVSIPLRGKGYEKQVVRQHLEKCWLAEGRFHPLAGKRL